MNNLDKTYNISASMSSVEKSEDRTEGWGTLGVGKVVCDLK